MHLYSGPTSQFVKDAELSQIAGKLKDSFFKHYRYNPGPSEINSWQNSLQAMAGVVRHAGLDDHGVFLEYQIPTMSKRLDCMLTGQTSGQDPNAVIVELKQWSKTDPSNGENELVTFVGGRKRELLHPSVQVGQYRTYLADLHTAFYENDEATGADPIGLLACSYLHNYQHEDGDPLFADKFEEPLREYPVFTADRIHHLIAHLGQELGGGEGMEVLRRIERSRYRPSKKLMVHVAGVIKGRPEYVLVDEQKVAYDKVFAAARAGFHSRKKHVVIIKGGPGTGKSVVAINLMADLLREDFNAHYATGSKAFTETLRKAIGPRAAVQFRYTNDYVDAEEDAIDVLIVDEAHRIRKESTNRFNRSKASGLTQVEEIIRASRVAVFFIDDRQSVRPDEIGSIDYIRENAERVGAEIEEFELDIQFRCAGSEAFMGWIDNTLGVEKTANVVWDADDDQFDFQIFGSPEALEAAIRTKDAEDGVTARMTAGYCWPWAKEPEPDGSLALDVVIGDYRRPWNARPGMTRLAAGIPRAQLWAYDPAGIDQVGCVYTAQGFEFDYVGVIFGPDLTYDPDGGGWIGHKQASEDWTVSRYSGDQFMDLIKNTYRILLSRGMKGCFVHFMDKNTERFFRSRMEH